MAPWDNNPIVIPIVIEPNPGLHPNGPAVPEIVSAHGSDSGTGGTATILSVMRTDRPCDARRANTKAVAVNLKTAKALGLTVPQSILLRGDEVIKAGCRPCRPRRL